MFTWHVEAACCTGARHGHEGRAGVKDGKDRD